jgi:hypothetical protein
MSRLDDLPPDQRATLSLLLRNRKRYRDVAAALGISERAVRDRAHAALGVLAAAQARALSAEQREEIGDYLLGQRSGSGERLATRTLLDGSPAAHAWASAIAAELQPLSAQPLPEIPPRRDDRPFASAGDAPGSSAGSESDPSGAGLQPALPSRASSRRAGAVLLGAIVIVVVVAVILILDSGGSAKHSAVASSSGETESAATSSTAGSTTGSSTAKAVKAKEDKRITLSSPDSSSDAAGVVEILSEGSQYAFYLAAAHLPPSKGFFYAVWLYNSPSSFEALSRAPSVGSSGSVQGGALLPKNAARYHEMLLTRETSSSPTSPGPIVLRGPFALH